jgi:hypothetical protein
MNFSNFKFSSTITILTEGAFTKNSQGNQEAHLGWINSLQNDNRKQKSSLNVIQIFNSVYTVDVIFFSSLHSRKGTKHKE